MDAEFTAPSRLSGSIKVPGDKSISHRALILASMCQGKSLIRDPATGADVLATRQCLSDLGIEMYVNGRDVNVNGQGWNPIEKADLDCRNSGSTMRLLAGPLAGVAGSYRLTGDGSLSRRPMDRIAGPLRLMGATIDLQQDRYPPMSLTGGSLRGISFQSPVASAQVKGAVLLAGLFAEGPTVLEELHPTRDHTERMLSWLGATVHAQAKSLTVSGPFTSKGFEINVPGDVSSAAYWIAAALCVDGAEIEVKSVGLNPTRIAFIHLLKQMGGSVEMINRSEGPEPFGDVVARSSGVLKGIQVGADLVPLLIDELPMIALLATQAIGTTKITGAEELRVKESDRISSLVEPLRSLGADIEEHADGMVIHGPTELVGGTVDPKSDHRIALTMAVAGLIAKEPVIVSGWECTDVSYPGFLEDLSSLTR